MASLRFFFDYGTLWAEIWVSPDQSEVVNIGDNCQRERGFCFKPIFSASGPSMSHVSGYVVPASVIFTFTLSCVFFFTSSLLLHKARDKFGHQQSGHYKKTHFQKVVFRIYPGKPNWKNQTKLKQIYPDRGKKKERPAVRGLPNGWLAAAMNRKNNFIKIRSWWSLEMSPIQWSIGTIGKRLFPLSVKSILAIPSE